MGAALIIIASLILNFAAGSGTGIQKWYDENAVVFAMVLPAAAALWLRAGWVQVAAPSLVIALMIAYTVLYYPSLG